MHVLNKEMDTCSFAYIFLLHVVICDVVSLAGAIYINMYKLFVMLYL